MKGELGDMKTTRNKIFISITVILFLTIGLLGFAFHGIEIEDHYGDLQKIYYKSRSGDLIILGDYKSIGIVDKTWARLNVVNLNYDTVDLLSWVYDNYEEGSIDLYRVKKEITFKELEKDKIRIKIQNNEIKKLNIGFQY